MVMNTLHVVLHTMRHFCQRLTGSCVPLLKQLDRELTQEESVLAMQIGTDKRPLDVTMV